MLKKKRQGRLLLRKRHWLATAPSPEKKATIGHRGLLPCCPAPHPRGPRFRRNEASWHTRQAEATPLSTKHVPIAGRSYSRGTRTLVVYPRRSWMDWQLPEEPGTIVDASQPAKYATETIPPPGRMKAGSARA